VEPPSVAEINQLSAKIVDAAYCVHTRVGPGLLESVYESVLAGELQRRGLKIDRQRLSPSSSMACASTRGYLRLLNLKLGLLINFGAPTIKEGIKRVVNGL